MSHINSQNSPIKQTSIDKYFIKMKPHCLNPATPCRGMKRDEVECNDDLRMRQFDIEGITSEHLSKYEIKFSSEEERGGGEV